MWLYMFAIFLLFFFSFISFVIPQDADHKSTRTGQVSACVKVCVLCVFSSVYIKK